MNKDEFILLLKEYKENEAKYKIRIKKLKNYRIELKHLKKVEARDVSITQSFGQNSDIHSKNNISNKVLAAVEKNDTRINELEKEIIPKLEDEVRELNKKIEAVKDRLEGLKFKERKLLVAYYIDGRSYEDIGNNLYWEIFNQTRSWETIKKIIEKATNKMLDF